MPLNRRAFLGLLPLALVSARRGPNAALRSHPEPRPGITAAGVVATENVPADLRPLFDKVRAIPQVMDGVRCYCGCDELVESYSLLSCYEGGGMAQACEICQREAEMVHRLHTAGRSLREIRTAIDRRFA